MSSCLALQTLLDISKHKDLGARLALNKLQYDIAVVSQYFKQHTKDPLKFLTLKCRIIACKVIPEQGSLIFSVKGQCGLIPHV